MKLCIVEDKGYKRLEPMTKTRPTFGLRCGRFTLSERLEELLKPFSDQIHYLLRPDLEPVWRFKNRDEAGVFFDLPEDGERLIINGRVLFHSDSLEKILQKTKKEGPSVWLADDTWAAMYLPDRVEGPDKTELIDGVFNLDIFRHQTYLNIEVINYPWDLIRHNSAMIRKDFEWLSGNLTRLPIPPLHRQVAVLGKEELMIGRRSEIYPFVTFDCSRGPVVVGDNVTIESGAFIKGPVSIGDNCLISANTKLYQNSTLGDTCKAGGEISHSIIHGFSNKRHSGFLGNAYLGEWVNLGAGTDNSNMKNNYNTVSMTIEGEEVDTGSQFIGLYMGDHCRTAIGSRINTASMIGVGCNLFGNGMPPKKIPDFTWGGVDSRELYDFGKFVENARRMMIRREVVLSDEEMSLLNSLHKYRSVVRSKGKVLTNGNKER